MITATSNNQLVDIAWNTFPGGERHVQLPESGGELSTADITMYFQSSDELIDLLLLINALHHRYSDITISLTIPYLPYARQDRVCAKGQAFSLEVIAQLIKSTKPCRVTTWDCHSAIGVHLLGAENITPEKIIACSTGLVEQLQAKDSVLICPDKGAIERCKKIQTAFSIKDMVLCEKSRNPRTGKITETHVNRDDLTGKTCVITDDICDGGYTFIKLAQQLKKLHAKKVVLYVTHGIFSKGLNVFDGLIEEIYTSNSLQKTVSYPGLTEIFYENPQQGKK